MACNPTSLSSNQSTSCSVTLFAAAPSAGATVTVSSNNPLLTVPASVTVAAGATTAGFTATAGTIPGNASAVITAGYNSTSQTASIQLTATSTNGTVTLMVAPLTLNFSFQPNGTVAAKTVSVSVSGGAAVPYTATASGDNCGWLTLTPGTGTTSDSLTVTASPNGLTPGTQTCNITISASGAPSQSVYVSFSVSGATLQVSPSPLTFNTASGTTPAGQNLSVSASNGGGMSFTASAGCGWLTLSPATGTTPATVGVTVNSTAQATPGSYTCTVAISGLGAPVSVPVTLVWYLTNRWTILQA